MPDKTLAIRIDEDLYKKIRIRLAEKGVTLKDYIISLINTDLSNQQTGTNDKLSEDFKQAIIDFAEQYFRDYDSKK